MRAILQRVEKSWVDVGDELVGAIGRGLLVLLGVETGDLPEDACVLAAKLATLRIFDDSAGKMNLGPSEVNAEFLIVSQFTLAGNLRRGRRPSFDDAAAPALAEPLVDLVMSELRRLGFRVAGGRFRTMMKVGLINDGPVTFVLDVRGAKVV